MSTPEIREIFVRSVVTSQRRHRSLPFEISINPYRGCQFGCAYCYAREFVYEDAQKKAAWGNWVEIKKNAVDALQRESHKLTGARLFLASATDPYQPIERKLGLTRALLEVILMASPEKLHIQTRSPHVLHDLALLQRFGETLTVGISLPTDSDVVRRAFEPRAPSIARRLKTAEQLKAAGIYTIASLAPLLPCTPQRFVQKLQGKVDRAWIGRMNFHEQGDEIRSIYKKHGWEFYLSTAHEDAVRTALTDAGLIAAETRVEGAPRV